MTSCESEEKKGSPHLEQSMQRSQASINPEEQIEVKKADESRIVRKFDWHLLVLFTFINLFSFIDRTNIGNARILGLESDLHLPELGFNIALMCFFVSYCVVELPSNVLCRVIGGHVYLPCLVFCFGIMTIFTALVENKEGLYAVRFLLGIFEGGISPGFVFMLSLFYRRHELGFRTSIYISASSASGAFGGLLAIGLSKVPSWGVIHSWKNIFFFEGIVSVILSIIAYFKIPSGPGTVRFLTEPQQAIAVARLQVDTAGTSELSRIRLKYVLQALKNVPILACAFGFFFGNTAAQSFSLFAPSIIRDMGYTNELAQLLSVGPSAATCAIAIIIGFLSDRYHTRGWMIFITIPFGIAGLGMLEFLPASMPGAKYGALYLATPGISSSLPLWITWAINNAATPTMRAVAAGLVFTTGSLGAILAPWMYLPDDAPNYRTGHAILFSFQFGGWVTSALLMTFIKRENNLRSSGHRDHVLEGLSPDEQVELSSQHPAFRYSI